MSVPVVAAVGSAAAAAAAAHIAPADAVAELAGADKAVDSAGSSSQNVDERLLCGYLVRGSLLGFSMAAAVLAVFVQTSWVPLAPLKPQVLEDVGSLGRSLDSGDCDREVEAALMPSAGKPADYASLEYQHWLRFLACTDRA